MERKATIGDVAPLESEMIGRAWIGVMGVAAFAGGVTWFGIIKPNETHTAPAAVQQAAPAPSPEAPPSAPGAPAPAAEASAPPPAAAGEEARANAAAAGTPPAPLDAPTPAQQVAAAEASQSPAAAAKPTPDASRTAPAPSVPLPTFDVVRVEPSGDTVVAGQGMAGATVELLRNGVPYARTVADVGGQWAIVPKPLDKGAAELSLRVTTPDGRVAMSEQVITVQVPEKEGDAVVVVLNAPNTPSKVLIADNRTGAAGMVAQAAPPPSSPRPRDAAELAAASSPAVTEPASSEAAKPVAVAGGGDSRANTSIKSVEADESGRFFVSGNAAPGAEIRIYLNETQVANVRAAADGSFGMTVEKGMSPGSYKVRADDIDAKTGKVLTRAEVPFVMEARLTPTSPAAVVTADSQAPKIVATRDASASAPKPVVDEQRPAVQAEPSVPAAVAEASTGVKPEAGSEAAPVAETPIAAATPLTGAQAPAPAATPSVAVVPEIKTVTIARGDNLWRISRKTYGRGMRYTVIYDANTDQIRDPDLIYPGQIFVMPDAPKD
jgi:nucleoid-associated protein YgaU